ncbi:MAG: 50S ribosomal protein L30 [Bdellovibrionales bacterium]
MAKSFRVTLKRGLIRATKDQQAAVRCLGLRKIRQSKVVADNPQNRGQIMKVQHLLDVKVEK